MITTHTYDTEVSKMTENHRNGPSLPALYFEGSHAPNNPTVAPQLPSELLSHCLSWANWGDLSKLGCIQSSWSNIVNDAAEYSNAARWELAQCYLHGTSGIAKNAIRALDIFRKLAQVKFDECGLPQLEKGTQGSESPFAPAMKAIAQCYFDGNGVPQDSDIGLAWLKASFELGNDVDAAHETAMLYEYGRNGIIVDVVAAAQWFERAAEAGHVEAMVEFGLCFELGCGVEQSDERALDWYTRAADLGHVTAKFSVAEAFEEARGVPQSDEEACLWYYRAALVGDEDSKKALKRLYDIARIVVPGVANLLDG